MSKTPQLALALQVWNGDVFHGLRLLKLICSIEPEKREDVEFIIAHKRDTNPATLLEMEKLAKTKFKSVFIIKGKRFGDGWPHSPNNLWQETMMRVSQLKDAGKLQSDGVLTFEADCIPLRPDWIDVLIGEWREARLQGKLVCGHAHSWDKPDGQQPDPPTHINGNAIFHAKVTDYHPELNGSDSRQGWDAFHGQLLLSIGTDTPFIFQRYRLKDGFDHIRNRKIDRAYIRAIEKDGHRPALFHGIKGDFGMAIIEEMVKDGTFWGSG